MFVDAPVLVCTYEVVLIRLDRCDARFVERMPLLIVDELHMLSDPERGGVPEAILTHPQLPHHVALVGLSGTLPNKMDVAERLGRCNSTPTRIVGLERRPIALEYEAYAPGASPPFVPLMNSEDRDFDGEAWDRANSESNKAPRSDRAKRSYALGLIEALREHDRLPAMLVDFSCRRLDLLAASLDSVDLLESKREKSRVHLAFRRLQRRVPPEEWPLFVADEALAKRGIGVHHAQRSKPYLELLPALVRAGCVKLVLATSTLSAGIDLPVRTSMVLSTRVPSARGHRSIDPALLQQIFGRAGRAGLETRGFAIVVAGDKVEAGADEIRALLCAPPKPVTATRRLSPQAALAAMVRREDAAEALVRSAFTAPPGASDAPSLEREIVAHRERRAALANPLEVGALEDLASARRTALECSTIRRELVRAADIGDTIVVDPEPGVLRPERWTIAVKTKRGDVTATNGQTVPFWWIFDTVPDRRRRNTRGTAFAETLAYADLRQTLARLERGPACALRAALDVNELDELRARVRASVSVQSLPGYENAVAVVRLLEEHGFSSDNVPTTRGKLAAGLLAPSDPLTLVDAWTSGELPRRDVAGFVAALTCFLHPRKHDDPSEPSTDDSKAFKRLLARQRALHGGDDSLAPSLGCGAWDAMRGWAEGRCVAEVCAETGVSPGHLCKDVLRLQELLRQMMDAARTVGDGSLVAQCEAAQTATQRGLPFLRSSLLR